MNFDTRVENHFLDVRISSVNSQGMMCHILDCFGALKHSIKADPSINDSLKAVFRGAVNLFLDEIIQTNYHESSAITELMEAFPDESKKRDGRSWLPLHWAAALETIEDSHVKAIAFERPLVAKMEHISKALNASIPGGQKKSTNSVSTEVRAEVGSSH